MPRHWSVRNHLRFAFQSSILMIGLCTSAGCLATGMNSSLTKQLNDSIITSLDPNPIATLSEELPLTYLASQKAENPSASPSKENTRDIEVLEPIILVLKDEVTSPTPTEKSNSNAVIGKTTQLQSNESKSEQLNILPRTKPDQKSKLVEKPDVTPRALLMSETENQPFETEATIQQTSSRVKTATKPSSEKPNDIPREIKKQAEDKPIVQAKTTAQPIPTTAALPPSPPILVDGVPVTIGYLNQLVDQQPLPSALGSTCESCGNGRQCAPGSKEGQKLPRTNFATRLLGGLYDGICNPDPCYQPKWTPLANAAIFTDGARPIGQTRFRWDRGQNLSFPDRGEFFWARGDGNGKGPRATTTSLAIPRANFNELSQTIETGSGSFSLSVTTSYRSINPVEGAQGAGFGDMILGTKSLIADNELFLLAFQMQTYLPVGNFGKGRGTGHTSLEPSLIIGLQTSTQSYLQGQISQWIPIGGDEGYQGGVLRTQFSFNHILWQPITSLTLIGSIEANTISFQDGAYTDPVRGAFQRASGPTFVSVGPGLRLFFCEKMDVGIGSLYSISENSYIKELVRVEARLRF
jgi:hypothetical protein